MVRDEGNARWWDGGLTRDGVRGAAAKLFRRYFTIKNWHTTPQPCSVLRWPRPCELFLSRASDASEEGVRRSHCRWPSRLVHRAHRQRWHLEVQHARQAPRAARGQARHRSTARGEARGPLRAARQHDKLRRLAELQQALRDLQQREDVGQAGHCALRRPHLQQHPIAWRGCEQVLALAGRCGWQLRVQQPALGGCTAPLRTARASCGPCSRVVAQPIRTQRRDRARIISCPWERSAAVGKPTSSFGGRLLCGCM